VPTTTRDKSGFTLASHQSQALCLGTLGLSGLLWPIAVWGFSSPLRFLAGWAAAGGGVWLLMKARDRWRLHQLEEGVFVEGPSGLGQVIDPAEIDTARTNISQKVWENAQYQRLRKMVEEPEPDVARRNRTGWGVITSAHVDGDQLVSYVIRTVDGYLATKGRKTVKLKELEELLTSVGSGSRWEIDADSGEDRIVGKLIMDMFPKAIAPEPPNSVAVDEVDAIRRHAKARWLLGVDGAGREVSYGLTEGFPHVLVVGGTGGGKSVWARTMIETFRVQGFTCFVASGKQTDFAALNGVPGIGMVAIDREETAVMIRTVRKEMDRRYTEEAKLMLAGNPPVFDYAPLLVVLDEYGSTAMEMHSAYKDPLAFMNDMDFILRKGRECKVHVALLSQTLRKTGPAAIPGTWQANLTLTVSLGEPEAMTLQSDAFTPETYEAAKSIGATVKGKAGRGLIAERMTGRVVEFQSYYGWSPGYTSLDPDAAEKYRAPSPEVRAVWERWVPVSDSVTALKPRLGIKAEGPEWSEGEYVDTIANTPVIALTDASGKDIPKNAKYDPRSAEWIGTPADSDFAGIGFDAS
jgi:hypothetical protein